MMTFVLKFQNKICAFLTTMMAMRPPTSPTTVMGGFSLGINTENETRGKLQCVAGDLGRDSILVRALRLHGISMLG